MNNDNSNQWQEYKLGELTEVQNGYSFQSGEFQKYRPDFLEVLKMGHIEPGGGLRTLPKKDYMPREHRFEKHILSKNDIVLAMTDMKDNMCILGHPAIIDLDNHYVLNQRVGRITVKDKNKIDCHFLFYQMRSSDFISELQSRANSGVQVNLTTSAIKESVVLLPPLPEQRAIAAVLSSLDDRIDLLNRQNKTLEGLAETLWRKMFVEDADPNWEECTLGDLATHEKPSINPNKNPETLFYHYSIPAFDATHVPIPELGVQILSNKYQVIKNTVLFSKLNPEKDKRIWLIPGSIPENSICSTEFQIVKPKQEKYLVFLYGFVNNPETYNEIAAGSGGTSSSHQRIDPEVIFKANCFIPDDKTLADYNKTSQPLLHKVDVNRECSRTLSTLRDALLPKLMSGEVRFNL